MNVTNEMLDALRNLYEADKNENNFHLHRWHSSAMNLSF